MARYIDADDLLNKLPNVLPHKASVKRVLIQAPTADVVEVIRCKDCLFADKAYDHEIGYVCKKPLYFPQTGERPHRKLVQDCDYCSYGVRRWCNA